MTTVNLPVPYLSQLDNLLDPYGSCNVTSVAMAMSFLGIVGDGNGQLEDQLNQWLKDQGLSRHSPVDMDLLFQWKKVPSEFTFKANWDQVRSHLDAGKPCIVHGYFTDFGHIIVIRGYCTDDQGNVSAWLVNDPYGEWFADGYRTDLTGEALWYSHAMMDRLCRDEEGIWIHFVG